MIFYVFINIILNFRYLDWINLISIGYHTAYEAKVNHHAPLYAINYGDDHDNIVKIHPLFYQIN